MTLEEQAAGLSQQDIVALLTEHQQREEKIAELNRQLTGGGSSILAQKARSGGLEKMVGN